MDPFDPRLTPARPDLAAARLEGVVDADRYVEGEPARVIEAVAPLHRAPRPDAGIDTEALWGETLRVYDEDEEGWSWVQLDRDGYVGWMPAHAILKGEAPAPTLRVATLATFVYPALTIKQPPLARLSFLSPVRPIGEREENGRRFVVTTEGGAIVADHLEPIDARRPDPVAVAETFLGLPYLWGGRSSLGIDCSGLVQTALSACGLACPRDTDQQEAGLGEAVPLDPSLWRRGDLLFWPGHVGMVRDGASFVHATGHTMTVTIEGLAEGLARIEAAGSPLRSVRRVL